ncbi:DEAD/DEAH box helicase [Mucilaginibacter koreensis]
MAWPEKLKLKKGLLLSLNDAGYAAPKEVQQKTLSRINGGQDTIAIGPEGCGKTTTYVLAVLNRFTFTADGITRALVLVPDRERVEAVIAQFKLLNNNKTISIVGLYATPGTEAQMDAMAEGADIVVATPDRARAIYLKLGLNLNKVELLVMDDAELIVKQGLQLPVAELNNALVKCQRLVFSTVMHDKLHKMIDPYMKQPALVEIEEVGEVALNLHPQLLYHVPNFGTKLNLLILFMKDAEVFTKAVVFVNTRPTAEKIYQTLQLHLKGEVAVLNSWFFEITGLNAVEEFKNASQRILIVTGTDVNAAELQDIPFLIHFELPETTDGYLNRVINAGLPADEETLALTFATDLELAQVKKIEQTSGQKMAVIELPEDLLIQKEKKATADEETKPSKHKNIAPAVGEAFHEKKASNAKTYNYKATEKAKMNKKKKHG